jgi:hypothetical protein
VRRASMSYVLACLVGVISTFGSACVSEDDADEVPATELSTQLTVPVPALRQFVLLSRVSASFGRRCIVTGGDLGVLPNVAGSAHTLSSGQESRLGVGEVLLAPRVVLAERATAGEIGASLLVAPRSATTGPRSGYVPPPSFPAPGSVNAGSTAINVNAGRASTLAPGRFGTVTVSGTLNLSGGLYELRSVRLNPGARLVALADATLRIAGALSLADRAQLRPATALAPRNLRLVVAGADANDDSVRLGADARLSALTLAERAFRAGDGAVVSGSIAAHAVIFGNDARLSFDAGFECSSGAGCDDGNACTLDSCLDAQCSHSPVANGSACDDGDACTHGDRCRDGVCKPGNELAVSELETGLTGARWLVSGPEANLWLAAPESSLGQSDGSLARVTMDGAVTSQPLFRGPTALLHGPDGKLWLGERLFGLPALGSFDVATRSFAAEGTGIIAYDLAASSDASDPIIWFTGSSYVGRVTTGLQLLASVPTFYVTRAITAAAPAPTTVLWFTEANGGGFAMVGRLAFPRLEQFAVTTPGELTDIVEGADGGIWFTDPSQNELGRMPAAGGPVQKYALPTPASEPVALSAGPDGNLWVSLKGIGKLARVTPAGEVTEICIPGGHGAPGQITAGPDGNIWFVESGSSKLGRVTLAP